MGKIIVVDFSGECVPVDFSPTDFFVARVNADARSITVAQAIKDAVINYAGRRKGTIVDFPLQ
jgi:hypothetical protein